jgi:hypothetical protein
MRWHARSCENIGEADDKSIAGEALSWLYLDTSATSSVSIAATSFQIEKLARCHGIEGGGARK